MADEVSRVVEQGLALPPEKRAEVADKLLASLDPPDEGRIEKLWDKEIADRLDAYDRGEVEGIPAEEVFEELRKKYGR